MSIKTYSELISLKSFEERFEYLRLNGRVGKDTFGYNRYLNQYLYQTSEWRNEFRPKIIVRDNGCDLACKGYEIRGTRILIHHINPITVADIINRNPMVFDPENVITVTHNTHNAIHYGDTSLLILGPIERSANDMCPWKK